MSPNFALDETFWVGTEQKGIWKTVNAGASFTQANQGISDLSITSLTISPNYLRDRIILASTWREGVFWSDNGGENWEQYSKGLTKDNQADLPNFNRPHFSDLSISQGYSQDRTVFLASFDGLFKSIDGGRVWRELNTLSSNIIVGLDVSPDYQNDSTIAISTYLGGAYLSQDAGVTWTTINQGLAKDNWLKRIAKQMLQDGHVARLFGIEFSPNYRQDQTIFSPSWTYFLKSTNKGRQWKKIPLTDNKSSPLNRPTKYSIVVSPNFADDKTIYLGSMQGTGEDFILKSTDGGLSFSVVGNIKGQAVVYLAISSDFATDKTLYAGVKDGVYKTVDGGQTWQSSSDGMPAMPEESKLTISPNYKADRTVFAGTAAGLFVTKDEGQSWRKLILNADTEHGYVDAVAISPDYQSDRTLLVSFRGEGLFRSVDGGLSFSRIGDNLLNNNHSLANMYGFWPPTTAIKFSPVYSSDRTIYGVAETNLFKSTDGGNTWANLPLPTPQGISLKQIITYYYLRVTVTPLAKLLVAALVASASYLILGCLRLDTELSLKKIILKTSGAFIAFLLTFMLFSI